MNYLEERHLRELASIVEPDRFSIGESNLDLHSRDQSHHRPSRPEAVVWPANRSEVSEILRYANENLIPVTGWGSGSSLEGNPIPVKRGLVMDFSQMNRILDIREEDFQADVEPGVVYQDLNEKLRHRGLFFPPDPGARATLGGMIANNASGTRTVRYGSTKDHVLRLSVALADGEVLELGTRASKSSSGYDLLHLFVGSEGTLGIVVEATVRLVGISEEMSAAAVGFPTVESAGRAVFQIMRSGLNPAALELLGPECIDLINREKGLGLKVTPTLFLEFHGASAGQLADVHEMAHEICEGNGCGDFGSGLGRDERDGLWKARHELGEMITRTHPRRGHVTVDIAVPISAYPEVIALARQMSEETDIPTYIFSHSGDGNLHLVLMPRVGHEGDYGVVDGINRRMVSRAIQVGGTATGEHGVGIGKKKFMPEEHGRSLEWMKRVKALFDPNGILNPGKIFP
jgi:D-lactate dehydrogenase (cytochrome)